MLRKGLKRRMKKLEKMSVVKSGEVKSSEEKRR